MNHLFDVSGKVVLITGASRGLGKAMALGFAEAGASIALSSRKLDACEKVASEVRALGAQAFTCPCHVGHWQELDALVDRVYAHFGRVDVLINNAGMSPLAPSLLDVTESLFDKVIGVNLKGPMRLTALVATRMAKDGGGSIINISSIAATKPSPLTTVYSAAKAGLNALTQAAAQEFAGANVRVNAIVCGTFQTDATAGFTQDEETLALVTQRIAQSRVAQPQEIVGTALYLASNAASYTTGECIVVDGGVVP